MSKKSNKKHMPTQNIRTPSPRETQDTKLSFLDEWDFLQEMSKIDQLDVFKLDEFVEKHKDEINTPNNNGVTALMSAAAKNNVVFIQALLKQPNLEVNAESIVGATALMLAARYNHVAAVKQLLADPRTDINHQGQVLGSTALMQAVLNNQSEVLRVLLQDEKININVCDNNGESAWGIATRKCYFDVYGPLLDFHQDKVSVEECEAALIIVAQDGHAEAVRALMRKPHININLCVTGKKLTPLMLASYNGHIAVVSLLLAHEEINVHLRDAEGNNALMLAASSGHSEVVHTLLAKNELSGVDIHLQNMRQQTVLDMSARYPDVLRMLFFGGRRKPTSSLVSEAEKNCEKNAINPLLISALG